MVFRIKRLAFALMEAVVAVGVIVGVLTAFALACLPVFFVLAAWYL